MVDKKLGQKPSVLIKTASLVGTVAIATMVWFILVRGKDGALERLPVTRVPIATETLSIPSSQAISSAPSKRSQQNLNASQAPSSQEVYEYKENGQPRKFVRISDVDWHEIDEFGETFNTFKEIERDSDFIVIYDKGRQMKIKLPVEQGHFLITWEPQGWLDIPYRYVVKRADVK